MFNAQQKERELEELKAPKDHDDHVLGAIGAAMFVAVVTMISIGFGWFII